MARRNFDPMHVFFQLDGEMRRDSADRMRSLLFRPAVDMFESEDALILKMEIAGVRPQRLNITLSADDRTLSIAGGRREEPSEQRDRIRCHHLEIYYGEFEREIVLPAGVRIDRESIAASYRDGFLHITLPKRVAPEPKSRTISISSE